LNGHGIVKQGTELHWYCEEKSCLAKVELGDVKTSNGNVGRRIEMPWKSDEKIRHGKA
jgi:hypothetical protein